MGGPTGYKRSTRWEWLLGALVVVLAIATAGVAIGIPGGNSSKEAAPLTSTEAGGPETPSENPETEVPSDTSVEGPTVQPTYSWVNAYSLHSTLDKAPLPVGAVVEAYDPQGTVVGRAVVNQEGRYGLMPLYQDDPQTSLDEGAEPGDFLVFLVNGFVAQRLGPDRPVWTANGDLLRLDLVVVSY